MLHAPVLVKPLVGSAGGIDMVMQPGIAGPVAYHVAGEPVAPAKLSRRAQSPTRIPVKPYGLWTGLQF